MGDGEKSLMWIVILFGLGFLAGSYTGAHSMNYSETAAEEGEEIKDRPMRTPRRVARASIGKFVTNAIVQLPNLPTVISWHLSNRVWLPITIIVLEAGALMGAIVL